MSEARTATDFIERSIDVAGHRYLYQVYVPSTYDDSRRWPIVLFLHGSGERGRDGILPTQVGLGTALRQTPSHYPAIVVFPQAPRDTIWSGVPAQVAMASLEKSMADFKIDADRVYLTGISMGGNGAWYLAYRHPEKFAAVAPICGWVTQFSPLFRSSEDVVPGGDGTQFETLARRLLNVPIWIFHGAEDNVVPPAQSRQAAVALTSAGANVRYTELPGIGHNAWDRAYGSPQFASWLFEQRRSR